MGGGVHDALRVLVIIALRTSLHTPTHKQHRHWRTPSARFPCRLLPFHFFSFPLLYRGSLMISLVALSLVARRPLSRIATTARTLTASQTNGRSVSPGSWGELLRVVGRLNFGAIRRKCDLWWD